MNEFAREMRRREARYELAQQDDLVLEIEADMMSDSAFVEALYDEHPEEMGRLMIHNLRSDIPHPNYVAGGQHQKDEQLVQFFIRRYIECRLADERAMGE